MHTYIRTDIHAHYMICIILVCIQSANDNLIIKSITRIMQFDTTCHSVIVHSVCIRTDDMLQFVVGFFMQLITDDHTTGHSSY